MPRRFGLRLRELRRSAGQTQAALAASAGLTKAGIASLEQGRHDPSWPTVLALAGALGVSCEAFCVEPTSARGPGMGRPRKAKETPAPQPPGRRGGGVRKGK